LFFFSTCPNNNTKNRRLEYGKMTRQVEVYINDLCMNVLTFEIKDNKN
jgi:hypothetical protein